MATYPAISLSYHFSVPGKHLLPMAQVDLCRVYFRITDVSGMPVENVVVSFAPEYTLPILARAGAGGGPVEAQTDAWGEGEINLVRGLRGDVSIYGTRYTRTVTVPDQAEQDLFYLLADAPDSFSIQVADVVMAPRGSI